jgi:PLP dependent protein
MNRAETLAMNLAQVRERITRAEARAGRKPGSVTLVAVSKKMPASDVLASLRAGQIDFGENYAQELRDKRGEVQRELGAMPVPAWHFIGPLQGNKAKYVAGTAALIHSMDTPALLDEVDRRVPEGQVQRCLVQVNVADEGQKRGVSTTNLGALLDHFGQCSRLRCEGFMLIPPQSEDPKSARPFFRALRELMATHATIQRTGVQLVELSMGMSHDLEVAVEEGATLVRVGTAIFGARV